MLFQKVTVYGGGLIGCGWAVSFVIKGVDVTVYDLEQAKLDAAKADIEQRLAFFADPGLAVLNMEQLEDCKKRLHYTDSVEEAVAGAAFIQENGPENVAVKRAILHSIEAYNDTAIIATSTSGLLISDIAAEAKHPERIVGGHPYHPVHLLPLVELAKGEKTAQETIDQACRFYREMGKEPVVLQKECLGFISNRIQVAVNREAMDLVERGVCTIEEVDKAVVFGPGLRWGLIGPHLIQDLGGGKNGGIEFGLKHIGVTTKAWLEDMAKWTEVPEGYGARARVGIDEEMANRTEREGRDYDGLAKFRDEGLVALLKYHGKL